MASFDPVHAAESDVARRHSFHGGRSGKISVDNLNFGPEAHGRNRSGHGLDLWSFEVRLLAPSVHDPVKVALFDEIRIDEDETSKPKARQLLDERAACS